MFSPWDGESPEPVSLDPGLRLVLSTSVSRREGWVGYCRGNPPAKEWRKSNSSFKDDKD